MCARIVLGRGTNAKEKQLQVKFALQVNVNTEEEVAKPQELLHSKSLRSREKQIEDGGSDVGDEMQEGPEYTCS